MRYSCPVCAFPRLPYPPTDYHICPCCGTEFGNDDAEFTHQQLREMWLAGGAYWFFGRPPERWNPWMQLIEGGHRYAVPLIQTRASKVPTQTAPALILHAQDNILLRVHG